MGGCIQPEENPNVVLCEVCLTRLRRKHRELPLHPVLHDDRWSPQGTRVKWAPLFRLASSPNSSLLRTTVTGAHGTTSLHGFRRWYIWSSYPLYIHLTSSSPTHCMTSRGPCHLHEYFDKSLTGVPYLKFVQISIVTFADNTVAWRTFHTANNRGILMKEFTNDIF